MQHRALLPRGAPTTIAAAALVLLAAACNGGAAGEGSGLAPGTIADNPGTGTKFVVEENKNGDASTMRLRRVLWGRLVDVYDLDAGSGRSDLLFVELLIGDNINTDGVDFLLEQSAVTGRYKLTILHPFGSAAFTAAFLELERNLQPFLDKGIDPGELPPFTALPRNAALAILLDDLLDDGGNPGDAGYPGSVTAQTVKVLTGYPPQGTFEARVFPDPSHGDLVGGKFHSTRVIVDMSVSKLEAQQNNLTVNPVGLPEAVTVTQPNVVLRIPTTVNPSAAQFAILSNLSGKGLSLTGNGHSDPTSPTLDVIRGFRSGGRAELTGDPFNGFLADFVPPSVLGQQLVNVTRVNQIGADEFLVDVQFQTTACASRPRPGDVLEQPGVVAEVLTPGATPVGGAVNDVHVQLLFGTPAVFLPGSGKYSTPWDPAFASEPACYVAFSPAPAGQSFKTDVPADASVSVSFTEPMAPGSVETFESFTVFDPTISAPLLQRVVGELRPSAELNTFTFDPSLPFDHSQGATETFNLVVSSGASGVTDLAGNPLLHPLPQVDFQLLASDPSLATGGIVMRFNSTNEDLDPNGFPELRGQVVYDLSRGVILPRAVQRFSALADNSQITVSAMVPFGGVVTPHTRYGSRLMALWRYHDLGMSLTEEAMHNIDVEGLNWMLANPGLSIDFFPAFRMALAHSKFLPDEGFTVDPMTGIVTFYPLTGVVDTFAQNLLSPSEDPLTVVHPKDAGYLVQPIDTFNSPTGALLAPWPLNRNVPQSQFNYWTWRDTATLAVGAPSGIGADTARLMNLDTSNTLLVGTVYGPGQVPTIGLPLLMEFRAYPHDSIDLTNPTAVALALPPPATQPYFRAFSSGGVLSNGVPKLVDPDQEITAQGGIDPFGSPTPPTDMVFYYGQADFVVRISRAHTIWFDTLSPSRFVLPVIEAGTLPSGTQVTLAFRGAIQLAGASAADARNYDPYGNPIQGAGFSATFLNGDATWHADPSELNGARFIQARITLLGNPVTGVIPPLSAMGIPFFK